MLTADGSEQSIHEFMLAGANAYLTKSCSPKQIADTIVEVMKKGTSYNDRVSKVLLNVSIKNQSFETMQINRTLSNREMQILKLILKKKSNLVIAAELGISIHTVHTYRKRIYKKTSSKSILDLILYAIQNHIILAE